MTTFVTPKGDILSSLLDARRQHTKWIHEVKNDLYPLVEDDHTLCDFGLWLIEMNDILGSTPEFNNLHDPHRELHAAYHVYQKSDNSNAARQAVIEQSKILINKIDILEHFLQDEVE